VGRDLIRGISRTDFDNLSAGQCHITRPLSYASPVTLTWRAGTE
jgi:hypothetical protein